MIQLQLHGPPCVLLASGAVGLSAREAALLAWLHLEGPSSRAALAGRLWPGGDEARARTNLRQTLARLKRAAGALLAEGDGVLRLAPQVEVVPPGSAPGLARLLGPIEFDDAPELADWLQARREAQQRQRLRERLARGQALLEAGDSAPALAEAEAVLAEDSTVEEAHRLRMQALLARGDRAAAIAAWDDCRLALRQAFGVAPSAATNTLGQHILTAEPAAAATPDAAPDAATLPAGLRHPPQLVGRDVALALLREALALGHGASVLGPGGSGKSRLLAAAAQGLAVLREGARPGDEQQPGALAARLLVGARQAWAPALDAATREALAPWLPGGNGRSMQSAAELHRALAAWAQVLLACKAQGLRAVLVDDLQYADTLSLEALGQLASGDEPLPLLLGARPDELGPAAQRLLQQRAASRRHAELVLEPLDDSAVLALLQTLPLAPLGLGETALPALARALRAQVGGHPAFVLESLKALWHTLGQRGPGAWQPGQPLPVPPTLREAVRERLARLSPRALQLAQLASVARSDFSLPLAASALGGAPLALAPLFAELEAAQVLRADGFEHDLVAEAVQASLPATLRPGLHRLVAEHLVQQQGPPARIAAHLEQAGDRGEAAHWHHRAGEQARARWQLAEAAASFEAAIAAYDPAARRAEALRAGREAARCHLWRSEPVAAARVLSGCWPLARGAADRVLLGTPQVVQFVNQRQVQAAVEQALALATDLEAAALVLDAEDINQALRSVCIALPMAHQEERALALLAAMEPRIDVNQSEQVLEFRLARGGLLARADRSAAAVPDLQAAFVAAQRLRRPGARVAAGGELLRALQAAGRATEALAVGEATLATVQDGGFGAGFEYDLRGQLAMLLFALGQPGPAHQQLAQALACHARAERPHDDTMLQGLLRAMAGQLDEAQALLDRYTPPPPGTTVIAQFHARARVRLATARGDDPLPWLRRAEGWGAQGLLHELALAAALPPAAPEATARLLAAAEAGAWPPRVRAARHQCARSALAAGDRDGALRWERLAMAMADSTDAWLDDTARRWVEAAELFEACGSAAEARQAIEAGRRWLMAGAATLQAGSPEHEAWLRGSCWHRALSAGAGP